MLINLIINNKQNEILPHYDAKKTRMITAYPFSCFVRRYVMRRRFNSFLSSDVPTEAYWECMEPYLKQETEWGRFLCMVQGDGEPNMTRMYIHR